jgi:ketosteroid isomerase-like protein
VDVVGRVLDLMAAGEAARRRGESSDSALDLLLDLIAPDHELVPAVTRLERGVFRGRDGYREFLALMDRTWESWEITPQRSEAIDDDRVLVAYRIRAIFKESGVPLDQELAWIMTVRDGRLVRTEAHSSVLEALKSAGPLE